MKSEEFPAWSSGESPELGGRDFLGLQSVGDAMLNRLLPGLTNQTKHPRYYAFFSWVFDQAHQAGVRLADAKAFRFCFESALIYAAASRHKNDFRGVVGILGATRGEHAWTGKQKQYPINQEAWQRRASAYSAPFYGPSFQYLGLLAQGQDGEIGLLPRGRDLAAAFEAGHAKTSLLRALQSGARKRMDGTSLAQLHDDLCPCAVRESGKPERSLLREMLFRTEDRKPAGAGSNERNRRLTLALLLDLIKQADGGYPVDDDDIRTLLYYWTYPSGRRYSPPPELLELAEAWRVFQARQYQRYALESLWVAYLRMLRVHRAVPFDPAVIAAEVIKGIKDADLFKKVGVRSREIDRLSVGELAVRLAQGAIASSSGSASAASWKEVRPTHPATEASWKGRIDKYLWEEDSPVSAFGNAVGLLLALWTRWRNAAEPEVAKGFMREGGQPRVSLSSMFVEFDRRQSSNLHEFLAWLLGEYTIGQHLRVSSHKLRTEGIDTFWFYSDEEGYRVHPERDVGRAKPGYNASKIGAATSALYDLGLLKRDRNDVYACTKDGLEMLKTVLRMESGPKGS